MFSRRVTARLGSVAPPTASSTFVRSLTGTSRLQRSPALSDVQPDQAHKFETRQKEFRENMAEITRRKKEQERQSAQSSSAASAAKSTFPSHSSPSDAASQSSTAKFLHKAGLDSLSLSAGEAQRQNEEPKQRKSSGGLSSLIYGTEEGREMDREIERSFSQVLARGKYVHSIVFHEVKPGKVDEYVDLVGQWYPRIAGMPENKVHLVGSWRTEVGECDTFGESQAYAYNFAWSLLTFR